jgi:hypothetical protein
MAKNISSLISENKEVLIRKGLAFAGLATGFLLVAVSAALVRPQEIVIVGEVVEIETTEDGE